MAGGRFRVDNALLPYRQEILHKHRSGHSHGDIIEYLERRHHIRISRPTFARILHEWTGNQRTITDKIDALRFTLLDLYHSVYGISDK